MLRTILAALAAASLSLSYSGSVLAEDNGHKHDLVQEQSSERTQLRIAQEQRQAACEKAKQPDNTPFSFWGYGHAKAHCSGWIDQLIEKSGTNCCSGVYDGGECRLTSINMKTREAEIDGMWCPIGNTDPVFIEGMGPYAIVCAGQTNEWQRENKKCPALYCKGTSVAN